MKKKYNYGTPCRFNVEIDPVDKSKCKEMAKERGQTLSAFVRDAVKSYCKDYKEVPIESSLNGITRPYVTSNYDIAI